MPVDGGQPPVKLSGTLAPGQEVYDRTVSSDLLPPVQLSADGSFVVYLRSGADRGIFRAPPDGSSPPVRLYSPRWDTLDYHEFTISPDGSWLLYRDAVPIEQMLVSVPTDGSLLANVLVSSGITSSLLITPDSTRAVYAWQAGLYSARLDGSSGPVLLDPQGAFGLHVSADGSRAVYLAYREGVTELYSVPTDGSASPIQLNATLLPGEDVSLSFVSPDGSWVLYTAGLSGSQSLYRVPIDGSASAIRLNRALGPGETVALETDDAPISPDGSWVVYPVSSSAGVKLFSVPSDRSERPIPISGTSLYGLPFSISPDGTRVVYQTFRATEVPFQPLVELFSVPIDGGHPPKLRRPGVKSVVRLNGPLVEGGDVNAFHISADSARVVYVADQETDQQFSIYSVPIGGGVATRLNDLPGPGGETGDPVLSADSAHVVFGFQPDFASLAGLYSVPIDGGQPPVHLNDVVGPVLGDVHQFQISPDGGRAVYLADQEIYGSYELYSVPCGGSGPAVKLNDPILSAVDGVGDGYGYTPGVFRITPDGTRVVYMFRHQVGTELYAAPIDGAEPPEPLGSEPYVLAGFQLGPDSEWVVYRNVYPPELFSLHLFGGGSFQLSLPLVPGGAVTEFALGPDGQRVVYLADAEVDGHFELYSVPIDRSTAPVKLNDPLVSWGNVSSFRISADSLRVVFLADSEANERFELYSVPADRGAAPVKLNGALATGGDVSSSFALSPDSTRVAYVADQATDQVFELYGVPIAGGSAPVRLSGTLVTGGDVETDPGALGITPDSARVLYVADQETDDVLELHGVPLDGSAGPIVLNAPLVAGGDVGHWPHYVLSEPEFSFLISPDSERVVYFADQDTDEVVELYSARITSARSSAKISSALSELENVLSCEIDSLGLQVAYVTEKNLLPPVWFSRALYLTPIDGGVPAVRLDSSTTDGQGVQEAGLSPNGRRVLYRADQDSPGVIELFSYSHLLPRFPRQAPAPAETLMR